MHNIYRSTTQYLSIPGESACLKSSLTIGGSATRAAVSAGIGNHRTVSSRAPRPGTDGAGVSGSEESWSPHPAEDVGQDVGGLLLPVDQTAVEGASPLPERVQVQVHDTLTAGRGNGISSYRPAPTPLVIYR